MREAQHLPQKWWALGVSVGLVLVVGALLLAREGTDSPHRAPIDQRAKPAVERSGAPAELRHVLTQEELKNFQLRKRVGQLERQLKEARVPEQAGSPSPAPAPNFRASSPAANSTSPLPFPADAPAAYQPEGFKQVAFDAARKCGMDLDVVALDCSEFPCIAWTKALDPSVAQFSMSGCAPWEEAFRNGTMVVGGIGDADAGSVRYFAWMPMPPDPSDLMIAARRARQRTAEMKKALGVQ